jgi:hypothetical protein
MATITTILLRYSSSFTNPSFSGALFLFWGFSAVCGAFTFASVVANADAYDFAFVSVVIRYSLVLAMAFLSFWSDGKPVYESEDDGEVENSHGNFQKKILNNSLVLLSLFIHKFHLDNFLFVLSHFL